ncbi:MAG: oligosaccharide flippase family protein, partial [Bacteroidota bacterium]
LVPFTIQFHPPLFREMVAYGMRNYTASLLLFLVGRVNLILINYKLGTSEAGVYSVAMQIIDVVYIFPSTIALLLFPKISGNLQDTGALTAKVLRFSTAAMAGLCAGIVLLGRPFIEILFGPSFSDAVLPLLWLTPGVLSLALATIIINDLAGRGLPPVVLVASAIALLLNLVLVIPALETYGLVGSALATSAAHVVLLAILLVYYMKRMKVGARELLLVRFSDFTSIRFSE